MFEFIIEKYNELSSGGITSTIILLLIFCFFFGLVKGAVRLIFIFCMFGGAIIAGYWAAEVGLIKLQQQWPEAPEAVGSIIGVIAGIITFFILHKIFGFLTSPFESNSLIHRFAFGIPGTIVSTVVAIGIVWFIANQLRDKGSRDELKYLVSQKTSNPLTKYPALAKLKRSFENSSIGKNIANIFSTHDEEKHNLAKFLVIAKTSGEKMNELAQDPRFRKIISNPKVRNLLSNNSEIQDNIDKNDISKLLENQDLKAALEDQRLQEELKEISSEEF